MPAIDIKKFTKAINVDGADVEFNFQPMNIRKKQLYQVYCNYNGSQVRFHLQSKDEQNFMIASKASCPKEYHGLEPEFSEAICNN
ncbi:hypothetical protein [Chitinophaga defluvii]|uniref:Uncharacterized protein n=1 Tax=Chitinophaga defluvii TaxID=3163343 RepID=A0ABV2T486_9BACT